LYVVYIVSPVLDRPTSLVGVDIVTALLRSAPVPRELTINSRKAADTVAMAIEGELDMASASAFARELREAEEARPQRITLDLSALEFIDSSGVHELVRARRRADAQGHTLVLTHVPGEALRLFRLVGADKLLVIR
jgi:anti-sigma B factor antagonist